MPNGTLSPSAYPRTDLGNLSWPGSNLSATARAKVVTSPVGTVGTGAGTTEINVPIPYAGTLTAVRFTAKDALAAHDSNYITFAILNRGTNGAGTTDMLSTAAANTTKATGGAATTAYTARSLTLHGTAGNLAVVAGTTLSLQIVATGTLANTITGGCWQIVIDVTA